MQFNIFSLNTNNYSIRTETLNDKKYIVVPAAMLVEGVHTANFGAVLHRAEEYGKIPESWNGIPAVVRHPEDENGNFISANSPEVIQYQAIGTIFNTHLDANKKLMSEVWIEEEKTTLLYPVVLEYIRDGRPLELSAGLFSDYEKITGMWNGERYTSIGYNYRPDHLALLPGEEGACSWADGCGIRANKKEKEGGENVKETFITTMKGLLSEGYSAIRVNIQGFREICSKIQAKLDRMDDDVKWHSLKEVYEKYFVYCVWPKGDGGEETLYRREYQVKDDDSIEFTGEPISVIQKTEYVEVNANTKQKGVKSMADDKKKKDPCCPEQVKLIIQSKQTRFEESDREWLESQEEGTVIKLLPVEPEQQTAPQVNKEQAIEVLKEQLKTPEQFLALLPDEMRDQMRNGLALYKAERNKLVEHITANAKDVFTTEELQAKPTDELKKLVAMAKAPVDYTGFGGGNPPNTNTSGPEKKVLPVGVKPAEEKK